MSSKRASIGALIACLSLGFAAGVAVRTSSRTAEKPAGETQSEPVPSDPGPGAVAGVIIDLANPECPVMGNSAHETVYTDWKGLRVRFCCSGCDEDFLEDPGALLRDQGIEFEQALLDLQAYAEAEGPQQQEHLERLRQEYLTVEAGEGRQER